MNCKFFEDYYEDLQISPNADFETIERVYRLLAKRYHPDNRQTGGIEKFEALTHAYNVLRDPEKRAAYDVSYEQRKARVWRTLSESAPADDWDNDQTIRNQILSVLYVDRRENPAHSNVGLWHLEKLTGWPEKILEFHIWYLKEKAWIQLTDNGGFAITATGIDAVDQNGLMPARNRLLPEKTGGQT